MALYKVTSFAEESSKLAVDEVGILRWQAGMHPQDRKPSHLVCYEFEFYFVQ